MRRVDELQLDAGGHPIGLTSEESRLASATYMPSA